MSRFENFSRCLANLESALQQEIEGLLEIAGSVKLFELAYETGWKALAARLREEGHEVAGPKATFRIACENGLLIDEHQWLDMISGRNLGVHMYDEAQAKDLVERIRKDFLPLLHRLREVLAEAQVE